MVVFEFIYTDCIYDGAMATISLHRTKKGAYQAMKKFIVAEYMTWYNDRIVHGKNTSFYGVDKFGRNSAWGVASIELEE